MAARQRRNNEGSIHQRKDGLWSVTINLGDGKRRCYLGKRREQVKTNLASALRLESENGLTLGASQTLRAYLKGWLRALPRRGERRLGTLEDYRYCIGRTTPLFGGYALSALSPDYVQEFYDYLSVDFPPATVRFYHAMLSRALNDAVNEGLMPFNPTIYAKLHTGSSTLPLGPARLHDG